MSKIEKEAAEAEYERFVENADLLFDEDEMSKEDLSSYRKTKARLIRAIMRGNLTVNERGEATYVPQNERSVIKDPITFYERTGASLMAMDSSDKDAEAARTYAVMADVCQVDRKVFAGLAGEDIKICEAIFTLLMD